MWLRMRRPDFGEGQVFQLVAFVEFDRKIA